MKEIERMEEALDATDELSVSTGKRKSSDPTPLVPKRTKSSPKEEFDEDSEYEPEDDEEDDDDDYVDEEEKPQKRSKRSKNGRDETSSRSTSSERDEELVGLFDDNCTKAWKERVSKIEEDSANNQLTVTRMITSEDFGESLSPWKLNTAIWEKLHPFQREGVEWMQKKTDHRSGGILADEMGLGKTVQTIAYLRSVAETGRPYYRWTGLHSALIVCHVSILSQWIKMLNEWFPKVRVFLVHSHSTSGNQSDYEERIFAKLNSTKEKHFPDGCVVLTTYNVFTKLHKPFVKHQWQVVFLDEGHYIRNENTQCSKAMRMLKTPQRFILTGTPFQNRLAEFWKLVDFVHPGRLSDSATFHRNFTQIINAGANLNCSPEAAAKAYECLMALHVAVKPLILRRLQEDHKDVLTLPEKNEMTLSCELSSRQRRMYEEYCKSQEVVDIIDKKIKPFIGFNKLGDICNHPGIYRNAELGSEKFGKIKDSGKVGMLFKLFDVWFKDPKNRVILFTQRRTVITMLEHFLNKKEIGFVSLTGSVTASARPKIIKNFEDDQNIKVFLMTTRAGGLGLNLTCANKVVIFDPDWNPQADNQAKNRIYRMGQQNDVSIIRLISNGTIEDRKLLKQVQKETLAAQLLHNTEADHVVVPNNTLADLFRLAPKGLEGSELGVYLPGEIAPDAASKGKKDKKEKKEAKKKMKNKLAGFEDRKLLISLFDEEKLVAMRQHSITVQNSTTMDRMQQLHFRHTVDNAVGSLIHSENRLAHTWKQEFHKLLRHSSNKPIVSDYFVEEEKMDEYWNSVQSSQFKANDDRRELNSLLGVAKKMLHYLNGIDGAKEELINRIFVTKHDRGDPTQMYFVREILSTLAKFNFETQLWHLRSKYRDVQILEPQNFRRKSESPLPSLPNKSGKSASVERSSKSPSVERSSKSPSVERISKSSSKERTSKKSPSVERKSKSPAPEGSSRPMTLMEALNPIGNTDTELSSTPKRTSKSPSVERSSKSSSMERTSRKSGSVERKSKSPAPEVASKPMTLMEALNPKRKPETQLPSIPKKSQKLSAERKSKSPNPDGSEPSTSTGK